jgi:hypothetical protein
MTSSGTNSSLVDYDDRDDGEFDGYSTPFPRNRQSRLRINYSALEKAVFLAEARRGIEQDIPRDALVRQILDRFPSRTFAAVSHQLDIVCSSESDRCFISGTPNVLTELAKLQARNRVLREMEHAKRGESFPPERVLLPRKKRPAPGSFKERNEDSISAEEESTEAERLPPRKRFKTVEIGENGPSIDLAALNARIDDMNQSLNTLAATVAFQSKITQALATCLAHPKQPLTVATSPPASEDLFGVQPPPTYSDQ